MKMLYGGKLALKLLISSMLMFLLNPVSAMQNDRWDSLMEQAAAEWQSANIGTALSVAQQAVFQGQYENADRHMTSLALLAQIAQDAGQYLIAERALREAIELIDRVPGPVRMEKAVLHNNLGALLDLVGDLRGAELNYRSALHLYRQLPEAGNESYFSLLSNLAGLLARMHDDQRAGQFYSEAEIYLPHVSATAVATFNSNFGALLHRQGLSDAARQRLLLGLSGLPPLPEQPLLRASILHNLGTLEAEANHLDIAAEYLTQSEAIRRNRLGLLHPDRARTLASRALLHFKKDEATFALKDAREATEIAAISLGGLSGAISSQASSQSRRDWRETLATHLLLLHKYEADTPGRAAEALDVMQIPKHGEMAKVFARALLGAGGDLGNRLQAIAQAIKSFEEREQSLASILQSAPPDQAREVEARAAIAAQRIELERLQADLARHHPGYHELIAGQSVPLKHVQSTLGADEAVLVYFSTLNATFGVVITKEAAQFELLNATQASLAATVKQIRQSVEPRRADLNRFAFNQSAQLYQTLLQPFAAILEKKSVWFVVPDGPLESLPFALLVKAPFSETQSKNWHKAAWVVREHASVVVPSLSALSLARAMPDRVSASKPLLAVANPSFGRGQPEASEERGMAVDTIWRDFSISATDPSKRLANPERLRRLTPLPDTADEAAAIAVALGGGDLLMEMEANEQVLKQNDLTQYRNLVFATHGLMATDLVEFGEPALVMTPPLKASPENDGLLSASEIAQLKLNADWVLLSACNTAAPDGTPGAEGLSGLAKAFFHAGARNILVSHWSVVSASTVELTTGAFRQLQRNPGISKARAVQRSMLELMDQNPSYRHPMYWAPFIIVGDGR